MKKILPILALSLLTAACVPHDPDEVVVDETPWGTPRTQTVETVVSQPVYTQQQRTVVVQPAQVQYAPQTQQVVVKQPEVQTSWWQQNKQRHTVKVVAPTCPCQDPNDPCTHCYQK